MRITFPTMTSPDNKFHTQQGKFYQNEGNNCWRRIECYMPAAPGTYHCATMAECAEKLFRRLASGEIKIKRGLRASGRIADQSYYMVNGTLAGHRETKNAA